MALNIGGGTGSAKVYLKFNGKAGRWSVRNLDGSENEVPNPTFIADFANIATGWMRFVEGQAPSKVMDPSTEVAAPRPSDDHKRGFVLTVYSKNVFGGAAEISGTSLGMSNAINSVYGQYLAERDANAGKVPVVECQGIDAQKGKFGTNYAPQLAIIKWADRPADLPDQSPVSPSEVYRATATTPQAKPAGGHVPPPSSKPASPATTEF